MIKIRLTAPLLALISLVSCRSEHPGHLPETGIFKVSILYPNDSGKTFDLDYYEKKHMPFVAGFLGKNLKFYEIDKGVTGNTPGKESPFIAVGHFYCYDVAEYHKAIGKNIDTILGDIKNYTNIQPLVQVSEIRQLK